MQMVVEKGWTTVDNPLRHSSKINFFVDGYDREMTYADGSKVDQKKKRDAARMTYDDTLPFITDKEGTPSKDKVEGYVDMVGYCKWLNDHSYFKEKTVCK
jgi:hypothetical protein